MYSTLELLAHNGKQREKGRKVGILEKEVALKFLVKDFVLYVHIEFEFYEFINNQRTTIVWFYWFLSKQSFRFIIY